MSDQVTCKKLTIATAGTVTQVDSQVRIVRRATVRNPSTNAGLVYFGGSNLAATAQASLVVGAEFILYDIDIASLYVTTANNNEKVEIVYNL